MADLAHIQQLGYEASQQAEALGELAGKDPVAKHIQDLARRQADIVNELALLVAEVKTQN